MIRRTSAAVALFVALALGACKGKEEAPQAVPVPTAAPTTMAADPPPTGAAPTANVPAGDAADGGADASAAAAAPTTPPATGGTEPATPKPAGGGSIDACCSALGAARATKNISHKTKIEAAYSVCGGIAKRVKAGETSRAAALTQIRSALIGIPVPGECR